MAPVSTKKRLSGSIAMRTGHLRMEKGTDKDHKFYLIAWDYVEECTREQCPLYEKCDYMKKALHGTGKKLPDGNKCKLQLNYLKHVMVAACMYVGNVSEKDVVKVGYHLLPLYNQLFKLKLVELSGAPVMVHTKDGVPKVNPLFKEIREAMAAISKEWKTLDLKKDPGVKEGQEVLEGDLFEAMNVGGEIPDVDDKTEAALPAPNETRKKSDEDDGVGIDFEEIGGDKVKVKRTDRHKKKTDRHKKKRGRKPTNKPEPRETSYFKRSKVKSEKRKKRESGDYKRKRRVKEQSDE